MSFFQVNREQAAKQEGGNHINSSGIYDITVLAPIVSTNDKGARTIDFYVDHNGTDQVIYGGLRLENNDGSANFSAAIFNKFCVIADVDDISAPEEAELPIGKEKAMKEVNVLADLADIECKIRIQMEYSKYQGEIKEKKVIKGFYRADGASSQEIINETEVGVNLGKDEAYADNVTYKDGLTEEDIVAWVAAGRTGGASAGGSTPAPKPSFSKKKFGSK